MSMNTKYSISWVPSNADDTTAEQGKNIMCEHLKYCKECRDLVALQMEQEYMKGYEDGRRLLMRELKEAFLCHYGEEVNDERES